MKKILWICNIMLPAVARELGLPYSNREGWLSGIFDQISGEGICLGIAFPAERGSVPEGFKIGGAVCFGFEENLQTPEKYDAALEQRFREIFDAFAPDMIHIFGTEFPHALAAAKAFHRPEATLVGIQGLCYRIAEEYMALLPENVQRKVTFRDFIRKDSLKKQQEKFEKRGKNERELLSLTGHVTGRTGFDREGTLRINPALSYHAMNETLRSSFYKGSWDPKQCEPYSIFLGQGDYPLKGFHFLLQAMPRILQSYPKARIYVAGSNILADHTLREKIKLPAYGKYLRSLIKENHLEEHVVMLGRLTEEEMKQRYLRSHLFVCPSILENSPNTVGEAMLLGVPVVCAKTGGIPDMVEHNREGVLFEKGSADALAEAVLTIFASDLQDENSLVRRLSGAARERACRVHDGEENYRTLLRIYDRIC